MIFLFFAQCTPSIFQYSQTIPIFSNHNPNLNSTLSLPSTASRQSPFQLSPSGHHPLSSPPSRAVSQPSSCTFSFPFLFESTLVLYFRPSSSAIATKICFPSKIAAPHRRDAPPPQPSSIVTPKSHKERDPLLRQRERSTARQRDKLAFHGEEEEGGGGG